MRLYKYKCWDSGWRTR